MSFSTKQITIEIVFDTETCEEISAEPIINRSEDSSRELRALLAETHAQNTNLAKDNQPLLPSRYRCPDCGGNLRLNSFLGEKFYFTHAYKNIDCPSFERGRPSEEQVRARQYNGRKEGADHKEIKNILRQSLQCAESFVGIDEEKYLWNESRTRWRKPDIAFSFQDGEQISKKVFEIQVSYTFVTVIYERKIFYGNNSIPLLWLFKDVDFSSLNITRDDALYSNNCNIFTVNNHTLKLSQERKCPILECHFMVPSIKNGILSYDKGVSEVSLFDLKYDGELGVQYAFDFKTEKQRTLRNHLLECVDKKYEDMRDADHTSINNALKLMNIDIDSLDKNERRLLIITVQNVLSALEDKSIGTNLKNMTETLNYVTASHAYSFYPFAAALNYKKKDAEVRKSIKKETFKERVNRLYEAIGRKDKELCLPQHLVQPLGAIFPELRKHLGWYFD